jgi:segregation and condensation protein B
MSNNFAISNKKLSGENVAEVTSLFPMQDQDTELMAEQEDAQAQAFNEALRIVEALIFAATDAVEEKQLKKHMPEGVDVREVLDELRAQYAHRGIQLVHFANKWIFRTASDLGWLLSRELTEVKKLSRPALETLAIIAYHQPVTRAEIEDIRGVALSKGTLDMLMETDWVRLRGRRKAPGRPVTYGTTDNFLLHFGLEQITDLPGLDELRAAGLFDGRLPQGFGVPTPNDSAELTNDEDPLEDGDAPADLFTGAGIEAQAHGSVVHIEAQIDVHAESDDDADVVTHHEHAVTTH